MRAAVDAVVDAVADGGVTSRVKVSSRSSHSQKNYVNRTTMLLLQAARGHMNKHCSFVVGKRQK